MRSNVTLKRSLHHRASRRQLVKEAFYFYILGFVIVFLCLHFVGIRHYFSPLHREYLSVDVAARQAILWALISPVLWVLQRYVLDESELWTSFWSLDWMTQRFVIGGAVTLVFLTYVAWRFMLPFWGLVAVVVVFIHLSRPKDSL